MISRGGVRHTIHFLLPGMSASGLLNRGAPLSFNRALSYTRRRPLSWRIEPVPLRLLPLLLLCVVGCSTLRTTDPARTATEQYLVNEAAARSVDQLATTPLRDRLVYVDTTYLIGSEKPEAEQLFLVGQLRTRLLESGARVTADRSAAQVILEVRASAVGVDKLETLFGFPAVAVNSGSAANVPLLTPELAIVKRLRQKGYASIAYVAYWRDTGEIVTSSGPFLGKTSREDFWIFGFGPRTVGDIPPANE